MAPIDNELIINPDFTPLLSQTTSSSPTAPLISPSSLEPAADPAGYLTGRDPDIVEEDWEARGREESFKFKSYEDQFNELQSLTISQIIEYEAARIQEGIRKARAERRYALKMQEEEHDDETEVSDTEKNSVDKGPNEEADQELFCMQDDSLKVTSTLGQTQQPSETHTSSSPVAQVPMERAQRKKPKPQNSLSVDEKRRSLNVGLSPLREKSEKKNQPKTSGQKRTRASDSYQGPGQSNAKSRKSNTNSVIPNLRSNVVGEAHANSSMGDLPSFTDKNKDRAVAQLIASIPTAEQGEAKADASLIKAALRKFTRRTRSDGKSGWKMEGLTSSIFNYQLLGAAWMRDRENSPQRPYGGLLCDEMGFGKTLQALVNIVDGIPKDPNDPVKTTLLVVPANLAKHWMDQMRTHCDSNSIGEVVQYHANARLSTLDESKSLQNYQVVITTYEEVRRSYPVFKAGQEVPEYESLNTLWDGELWNQIGPLHKIKFQRIILDEAHIIKNRNSRVSLAVRALTGKHKWLLSGTPIQNAIEEFYPLFDFLEIPHIGGFSKFMKHFCHHEDGPARLSNYLRSFMYRRTYSSRLFNMPIVKLPDISENIVKVKLCDVERTIYTAIVDQFLGDFNDLANAPNFTQAQSTCFLKMIMKLRMFCSHILTVQDIVKPLLSGALIHKLTALSQTSSWGSGDPSSRIIHWLKEIKKDYKAMVKKRDAEEEQQESQKQAGPKFFSNNPEVIDRYSQLLKDLHQREDWMERLDRETCPRCNRATPDKQFVTSCLHLYCEECIYLLDEQGDKSDSENPLCLKCGCTIEETVRWGSAEEINAEKPLISATEKGERSEKHLRQRTSQRKKKDQKDEEEDNDWILACGPHMPSAKLTAIQSLITKWKTERKGVKVVIFSQFMNFIRIVTAMCKQQGWNPTCLTGKMSLKAREQSLEKFRKDPNVTVMIVSLHTGRLGLDMTAANKCILVDLWWNEAVQTQAYCRLFRIGQERAVECVKLIVEDAIDDYMLRLQSAKTDEIDSTMGEDVLKKRDNVKAPLKMFVDVVKEDDTGRLRAVSRPQKRKNNTDSLKQILTGKPADASRTARAAKVTDTAGPSKARKL